MALCLDKAAGIEYAFNSKTGDGYLSCLLRKYRIVRRLWRSKV